MGKEIRNFSDEYSFLNNWYPTTITYMGLEYTNADAAFLAQKCRDVDLRYKFCGLGPIDAEQLSQKLPSIPIWDDIKVGVMKSVVGNKFRQNYDLGKKLIYTGSAHLVFENSYGDDFWGVDRKTGKGENWLGRCLMEIRKEIREREKPLNQTIRGRGISIESGEMVYGSVIQMDDGIVRVATSCLINRDDPDILDMVIAREVLPQTISFYTGYEDKNGAEIYTKDVVDCPKRGAMFRGSEVVWDAEKSGFALSAHGIIFPLFYTEGKQKDIVLAEDYEVIGNTIFNPELTN